MLPVPKVRYPRKQNFHNRDLPAPARPVLDNREEPEVLSGTVQNLKASAGEERFAKALAKITTVQGFQFRYTTAPRGLPAYKELDYLISARGMVYAVEVDTAFTHRDKGRTDILHDALILKHLEEQGYLVYPTVIHLDGESDLVSQQNADMTAKRLFQ